MGASFAPGKSTLSFVEALLIDFLVQRRRRRMLELEAQEKVGDEFLQDTLCARNTKPREGVESAASQYTGHLPTKPGLSMEVQTAQVFSWPFHYFTRDAVKCLSLRSAVVPPRGTLEHIFGW